MAKIDTARDIKAKFGVEVDAERYTQRQLDDLLVSADRASFDAKLAALAPLPTPGAPAPTPTPAAPVGAQPTTPPAPATSSASAPAVAPPASPPAATAPVTPQEEPVPEDAPTKTVKVNTKNDKVAPGAAFIHPAARKVITAERAVTVPDDAWTEEMLAARVLVEAK